MKLHISDTRVVHNDERAKPRNPFWNKFKLGVIAASFLGGVSCNADNIKRRQMDHDADSDGCQIVTPRCSNNEAEGNLRIGQYFDLGDSTRVVFTGFDTNPDTSDSCIRTAIQDNCGIRDLSTERPCIPISQGDLYLELDNGRRLILSSDSADRQSYVAHIAASELCDGADGDVDVDGDVDSDSDSDHDADMDTDFEVDIDVDEFDGGSDADGPFRCLTDDECIAGLACVAPDCIDLHCTVGEDGLFSSNDIGDECFTDGCNAESTAEERCGCNSRGRTVLTPGRSCDGDEICASLTGNCEFVEPDCTLDHDCAIGLACDLETCVDLHCTVDGFSSSNDIGDECFTDGCNAESTAEEDCECDNHGRPILNPGASCDEGELCNPTSGDCELIEPVCTSDDECAAGLACEGDDCIDLHCIVDEGELSSSNDVGPDCDTTGCNEALDAEERCGCTDRGRTNLNATSCAEREECNPDTGACEPVPCVPCCGITEGTWSGLITLGADRVTSAYDFGGYRPFYTNHGTFGRTLVVRRVSDNFPVGEIAVLYNATLTISNDANCMRVEVDTGSLFDGSLLDITERRVIRILP